MYVFNTLTRKKEPFTPLHPPIVTLYTCGPTVYNYAHIGNLRTYIFQDLLDRTLQWNGYAVKRVMNITDVGHLTSDSDEGEDKMEKGASREGKSVWDIAMYYTNVFLEDLRQLNCVIPKELPKATEYIQQMIELIQRLEQKGVTYQTSDGIYFDTSRFPRYGDLAKLDISGLQEGARVEFNKEKRNPTDFALWKFSPVGSKRQMEWDSPWGIGFPGWHIECSAMAMESLGETVDIHTGGVDHIPVHHSNEIAQSEAATGKQFVRYWMHGEFLVMGEQEEKMAKSGGNFITLAVLKEQGISPLAYRYFCLMTHYRSKLHFSLDALHAAQQGFSHLQEKVQTLEVGSEVIEPTKKGKEYIDAFKQAVSDDLNAPIALTVVGKVLKDTALSDAEKYMLIQSFDQVLGLQLQVKQKFHYAGELAVISEVNLEEPHYQGVQVLLQKRMQSRKEKQWQEADKVREQLEQDYGLVVEDTAKGVLVKTK